MSKNSNSSSLWNDSGLTGGIRERIVSYYALILVFLLPLKFGGLAAMPEVPQMYPDSLIGLLILPWPLPVFTVLSGGFAMMVAIERLFSPVSPCAPRAFRMTALWFLLAAVGLLGIIRASTLDYAIHEEVHLFGLASFALAIYGLLQAQPKLKIPLLGVICAGVFCSSLLGLYNILFGFEETKQFTYEQELRSGVKIATGNFKERLEEMRVYGSFTICNSFAAHLALTIPVFLWAVWRTAAHFDPPKLTRAIFMPVMGVFLGTMLFYTGSRGGMAAFVLAACAVFFCAFPFRIKKILLCTIPFFIFGGIFGIEYLGRGFKSLFFRFDYWLAAGKILFNHPLTGTGWGDFFHEYMIIKQVAGAEAPHMAHNMLMDFASQTGILGLLVSSLLLAYPVFYGLRYLWKQASLQFYFSRTMALTWGFLAWGIHSLTDVNMQISGTMACAAIISLVLLMPEEEPASPKESRRSWRPAWISGLLLGALACAGGAYLGLCELTAGNLNNLCDPRFMTPQEFAAITPAQVEKARQSCEKLMPYSPFSWGTAADFMAYRGDFWTAERYYKEAIRRSPERPSFYSHLAQLQACMGKRDDAEANMKKARELFPNNNEYTKPLPASVFPR